MITEFRRKWNRTPIGRWLCGALLATSLSGGVAFAADSAIQASVNHPARVETDVVRDNGRKPAEVLRFFGVKEGARVIEIGAGGGYYTELLSRVVGDDGFVYAYNPFLFLQFITDEIKTRYSKGQLGNVVLGVGSLFRLDLRDDAFDAVYIINTYHDIAYQEATGEAISRPALATLQEVRRILKPGGTVGVVDHRAKNGAKRADAAEIHRIAENTLRQDFENAGFILVGSADFLINPSDDRSQAWFSDPKLKDATDRMVLRFKNSE
jgi:predicted methyltransferase